MNFNKKCLRIIKINCLESLVKTILNQRFLAVSLLNSAREGNIIHFSYPFFYKKLKDIIVIH